MKKTINCPDCFGTGTTPCSTWCDSCRGTGILTETLRVERRRRIAFRRWRLLRSTNPLNAAKAWLLVIGWDRKHHELKINASYWQGAERV